MEDISIEDMMALQNNNYSIKAEEALPLLLQHLEVEQLDAAQKRYYDLLKSWNYEFGGKAAAPIFFDIWYKAFYRQTWDEIYALEDSIDVLFPEDWRTIALLKADPQNDYFDLRSTEAKETATALAVQTFQSTCAEVDAIEQQNGNLHWQSYKKLKIAHLGRIPAFTRYNIPIGGYSQALNAVTTRTGPSWRMIVELGETVKAYGIYPGGQSGNPGSPFYDNMIDDWAQGKYYPILFMQSATENNERILFRQQFGK